jgi:hypothetical protein
MSYSELREVTLHEANKLLTDDWILVGIAVQDQHRWPGTTIVYVMGRGIEPAPEHANVPHVPERQWQAGSE